MPIAKAGAQCRVPVPSTSAEPSSSPWGQARPMGAVSHRPHARARQHRTLGKPPGQIPSQHQTSGEWQEASGKWQVASGKWWGARCALWLVNGKMSLRVWVYLLTQCISNSQRIRADSARVDWSKAVQASSVQVPKNWGLVRSRSKNFLDWTWTRLDGSSPDWSIAGLVESLGTTDILSTLPNDPSPSRVSSINGRICSSRKQQW